MPGSFSSKSGPGLVLGDCTGMKVAAPAGLCVVNSTIVCSEYNSSRENLLSLETWASWDSGAICASLSETSFSFLQTAEETLCRNKCVDQKLRAAHIAGWCCLSWGVGFLILCRAAAPGSPVSSWPWQSFQGGWSREDWRFRGHGALRMHRLERVQEPIRSRGGRSLELPPDGYLQSSVWKFLLILNQLKLRCLWFCPISSSHCLVPFPLVSSVCSGPSGPWLSLLGQRSGLKLFLEQSTMLSPE